MSKRDDAHHLQWAFGCTETVNLSKPGRRLPAMFHRGRQGLRPGHVHVQEMAPLSLIFEGQAPALR
jgi:hypothetical protein